MNLPDEQRVELRELAEKATGGKWWWVKEFDSTWSLIATRISPHTTIIPEVIGDVTDANRAFIAAASPSTVLSLLDRIEELEAERDRMERKYRERIWLGHGCQGVYGDDGEMQCNNFSRHGLLDFKRDSVEKLDAALYAMNLKEISDKGVTAK